LATDTWHINHDGRRLLRAPVGCLVADMQYYRPRQESRHNLTS